MDTLKTGQVCIVTDVGSTHFEVGQRVIFTGYSNKTPDGDMHYLFCAEHSYKKYKDYTGKTPSERECLWWMGGHGNGSFHVLEPDKETSHQVGGSHYCQYPIEPITFIQENNVPFCEGNVIKYIMRWRDKGGVDDLRKAKQYIDFLIDKELKVNPTR